MPAAATPGIDVAADAEAAARAALSVSIAAGSPLSQREIPPQYDIPAVTPGGQLIFNSGRQPYTRWMTGHASSIVVMGYTSYSIHGVYCKVTSYPAS